MGKKMRKLFQTLGPRWSRRRKLPTASGVDILGMWQLSEIPGDCHITVGHYIRLPESMGDDLPNFDGWYDDLGQFISGEDPMKWAPIPSYYE